MFRWAILSLLLVVGCNRSATPPPNILIILADDLGWNQLGCYGGPYETPAIDRLAGEGKRFTDAYASAAVCSPTRAALMTGRYPARLHITDFIQGSRFPDSLLKQPEWQKHLPLEEITLAELFKKEGYQTALFGKWHLSQDKKPPDSTPYNPDKQGFDEYMVTYKPVRRTTDPSHDPHNVDSISERAVTFLREYAHDPFFLVVAHNSIHDPVMESQARISRYKTQFPATEHHVVPVLGAMVNRLDNGTETVLQELKELGLVEQTIVIFCSDNGGKHSYADQTPFRKGKGWLYEGGIRVPLIIRWPGKIAPGTSSNMETSTVDLLPTLIDLAGMNPLEHPVDGISIATELFGDPPAAESDRKLFWHYPHYHKGSGMKPASAMRSGNYKLIEWHEELLQDTFACELYDLESDPGETHDLSHEIPELLDSLRNELHSWRKDVRAQMPELRQ